MSGSRGPGPFDCVDPDCDDQEECHVREHWRLRGYEPLRMSGTCRNGAERDSGRLSHAVAIDANRGWARALCGARPGKRGNGWSEHVEREVTCVRCITRMVRLNAAPAPAKRGHEEKGEETTR